jgi:hypothetical protein
MFSDLKIVISAGWYFGECLKHSFRIAENF